MECVLETGPDAKTPNDIDSSDVITAAMKSKDPLCVKVVQKFGEIFAV